MGTRTSRSAFERTALRFRYVRADPRDIAICHHNLASHLRAVGADRPGQRAHRLAAALIGGLTGMNHDLADTRHALAAELHVDSGAGIGSLPVTLAEVIRIAELTEGIRLCDLIAALQPDRQVAEAVVAQIIRDATRN